MNDHSYRLELHLKKIQIMPMPVMRWKKMLKKTLTISHH